MVEIVDVMSQIRHKLTDFACCVYTLALYTFTGGQMNPPPLFDFALPIPSETFYILLISSSPW